MNNQERAEKIALDFAGQTFSSHFETVLWIKNAVTSQLDEAVSDALKERETLYEKDLKHRVERAVREAVLKDCEWKKLAERIRNLSVTSEAGK